MWHSRHRHYHAKVCLSSLPQCPSDEVEQVLEQSITPADRASWNAGCTRCSEFVEACLTIQGRPDTEYRKDGLHALVDIPDSCDYWVDDEKVVIVKRKQLCPLCHSLLDEREDVAACMNCMRIWERR
jgi:ribosomal protein S27AE